MIDRVNYLKRIEKVLKVHSAVAILGPRQCGKTTLARNYIKDCDKSVVFDLESPIDLQKLSAPMQILKGIDGVVVIDEVQRKPELFEVLRVLIDDVETTAKFILLGSASLSLVKGVSESLAGRIGYIDLGGFNIEELGSDKQNDLWLKGGFPRSFLVEDNDLSLEWRTNFIRNFLERDIPQLGITIPAETLRRFWQMVCHYHGQVWNAAEFAKSLGTAESTARRYLDILAGGYVLRVLHPWFENIKKRQIKSPKIYVRDSGLLHSLLNIPDINQLRGHHKLGASWEGFALEQVLSCFKTTEAYFWGTHAGAELDLMIVDHGKRYGFEFKYADAPGSTKSMRSALSSLSLDHLWILYPGTEEYSIDDKITVKPLSKITSPENLG